VNDFFVFGLMVAMLGCIEGGGKSQCLEFVGWALPTGDFAGTAMVGGARPT